MIKYNLIFTAINLNICLNRKTEKSSQYNGLFTEDKSCDTVDVKTVEVG